MTRKTWIIVLVAGGIGLAILIGVLGTRNEPSTTKAQATTTLCGSLTGLQSSLNTLTSLDPSTATKDELNSDVTAVQNSWTQATYWGIQAARVPARAGRSASRG